MHSDPDDYISILKELDRECLGAIQIVVGSAPSNYIVKQSHVRLSNIVVNEQMCFLTAKKLELMCRKVL